MSKPSKKKNSDCPIEFCWATFCRGILQEEDDRTIYGVLPAIAGGLSFDKEELPEKVVVSLQPLCVYAVFKRKEGFKENLGVSLKGEFLSLRLIEPMSIVVPISAEHIFCQVGHRFRNLCIEIQSDQEVTQKPLIFRWLYEEQEIGRVELMTTFKIQKNKKIKYAKS